MHGVVFAILDPARGAPSGELRRQVRHDGIEHRKSGLRHLLTGMSAKRGRNLHTVKVEEKNSAEGRMLKAYLPYE